MKDHRYRCVRQHDITDCGPACLATIAGQYGLDLSLSRLRTLAGTDKEGTNLWGLARCAEKIGFDAEGVKGDREAFMNGFQVPAIANVIINGNLLHYVVVEKVSDNDIIVSDPGKGIVHYKPDEFFAIWTGALLLLKPNKSFHKGKFRTSPLKICFNLMLQQRKVILPVFLLSLPITAAGIIGAFYYQYIINSVSSRGILRQLNIVTALMLVMYLGMNAMSYLRGKLIIKLSNSLDTELVFKSYEHVLRLPMTFFENRRAGEIVSRFSDAAEIRDAVSESAVTIMLDGVMAVAGGCFLYHQNSALFEISLVLLVLYGIIAWRFIKPQKKIREKIMEDNSQFMSHVIESVNGEETIKSCTCEKTFDAKADRLYTKYLNSIWKGGNLSIRQGFLTGIVSSAGNLAILWIGTCMALNGLFSMGELITFVALMSYFLTPVQNIIDFLPRLQTALVSVERLYEILELETEIPGDKVTASAVKANSGSNNSSSLKTQISENSKTTQISETDHFQIADRDITFSNLNFRYGTRKLVLHDINLKIKAGEKLAIVGESGCGKTTLTRLLLRFFDFENGNIWIGDTEIRNIPVDVIRSQMAYVSQNVFLFSGSIRDNLTMGRKDIEDSELERVCRLCCMDEFVQSQQLGLDTYISENGASLSGGQKQRLAIARALLRKPSVLILDEATSSLDTITENSIRNMIEELPESVTVITIAHRLSTIMNCDRIIVMEKGRIADSGTHRDLIERNSIYREMWLRQEPENMPVINNLPASF